MFPRRAFLRAGGLPLAGLASRATTDRGRAATRPPFVLVTLRGGAMFVLGGRVRGGRMYGRWPGLGPARAACVVEPTMDLSDLLNEILVRHGRARQPEATFPGHPVNPDRWPGVIAEVRT